MKLPLRVRAGMVTGVLALAGVVTAAPSNAAAAVAEWQLNEASGSTVMRDSSGNGLNGVIGNEVVLGATYNSATGYRFPYLKPNTAPAHPEHIVRVPSYEWLNPGNQNFSVEVRYRTTNPFGNLIQKGQSGARGGYWKIQLPQGEPSCLYRGPTGVTNAVRATTRIDDGQWHTIKCNRVITTTTTSTQEYAELAVDNVVVGHNTGVTGTIANSEPVYFGGKGNCDQVIVTCDYFGGDVDYVKIFKG